MPGINRWCLGIHPNSPRKQGTFTVLQLAHHADSPLSHPENSVSARRPLLARIGQREEVFVLHSLWAARQALTKAMINLEPAWPLGPGSDHGGI